MSLAAFTDFDHRDRTALLDFLAFRRKLDKGHIAKLFSCVIRNPDGSDPVFDADILVIFGVFRERHGCGPLLYP